MTLLEIVQTKERELRLLPSEEGVAFDSSGNVVLEKSAPPGAAYEIEFSDEEIETLRALGDITFTHNHPRGWNYPPDDPRHRGSSFSPEDVRLACRAELAEIRAVTPVCTFSLKPSPESPWTEETWSIEIGPLYDVVYPQAKSRLYTSALRGEVSPAEASARLDHEVWTEIARLLGLRYNRVEDEKPCP